jgi:hypothetical protein
MAKAKSFQGIVGWKKNTNAWGGAAVAAGALNGIKVISCPLEANTAIIPTKNITGRATQLKGDTGNKIIQGDILTAELVYEGHDTLIAPVLGSETATSTVDTTARKHVWKVADSLDGIYWTLAYEIMKDALIDEFNTVKATGFTIRGQQGGRVMLTVRGIGHDFSAASAVNTTTTIDTITTPANSVLGVMFRQLVVRLNDESGGALGASDVRYVSAFEINVDRNLELDFTSEFGNRTSEPQPPDNDDPFTKVTGSLTFSHLDNASPGGSTGLRATQLAGTSQKIDLTLTGDTLAGSATQKFQHIVYLPSVQFGDGKPTLGKLGWTLPFTAWHTGAAPTGFPAGYLDAINWEAYNQRATDALA